MTGQQVIQGCACCSMNRRQFLAGCAACVGTAGVLAGTRRARAADPAGKVKVRVIYALHGVKQSGPDWPNVGFDFKPVMDRINADLRKGCPEFEFVTSLATGEEQAKKILEADGKESIDGYVVYQMNAWNRVVQSVLASGKPTLYADFQYAESRFRCVLAPGRPDRGGPLLRGGQEGRQRR
jgi:hypothetical protein